MSSGMLHGRFQDETGTNRGSPETNVFREASSAGLRWAAWSGRLSRPLVPLPSS